LNARDFIKSLSGWSYTVEEDRDYPVVLGLTGRSPTPKGYHAVYRYNGAPAGGASNTFTDVASVERAAKRQIREFKRLQKVLPFRPSDRMKLWSWRYRATQAAASQPVREAEEAEQEPERAKDFIKRVGAMHAPGLYVESNFQTWLVSKRGDVLQMWEDEDRIRMSRRSYMATPLTDAVRFNVPEYVRRTGNLPLGQRIKIHQISYWGPGGTYFPCQDECMARLEPP
jgi:hypothetical protein